jgi:PRC-barrel domain protein
VLHKTSKVSGFHIHATGSAIGHVDDFLFDEQWTISHPVVDTSNWLGGKWVLISTAMVSHVDSPAKRIDVTLTREEIVLREREISDGKRTAFAASDLR